MDWDFEQRGNEVKEEGEKSACILVYLRVFEFFADLFACPFACTESTGACMRSKTGQGVGSRGATARSRNETGKGGRCA